MKRRKIPLIKIMRAELIGFFAKLVWYRLDSSLRKNTTEK
jgi:hypothetical protein